MVKDFLRGLEEGSQTVTLDEADHAAFARAAGGHLSVQVADDAFWHAAVEAQQVDDFLVENATFVQLHGGQDQAFLKDIDGIQDVAGVLLPHIEPVLFDGGITDQLTASEDGRNGQHIQRMSGGPVRIIGEDQIAGF